MMLPRTLLVVFVLALVFEWAATAVPPAARRRLLCSDAELVAVVTALWVL